MGKQLDLFHTLEELERLRELTLLNKWVFLTEDEEEELEKLKNKIK